jgi:molecular chaperone DnaJ
MPAQQQQDYYGTLGLERKASADEIRKAYRRLARKYHPDLNPGDKSAEDKFKKVQEAYDVLSDTTKKQMFDQYGFYSDGGFAGAGGTGGARGAGAPPNMNFGGFDFSEIFSGAAGGAGASDFRTGAGGAHGGGGFQDIFGKMFGNQQQRRQHQQDAQKGADLEYALAIDFWQAIKGTQVRINVQRHDACATCGGSGNAGGQTVVCSECNGSGNVNQMAGAMRFSLTCPRCNGAGRLKNVCPACQGDGRVTRTEGVDVRIPAGAQDGSRLRVAGKGNAGSHGAPAGDLYITVRSQPHPFFRRNGDDVEITVPVRIDEAYLGAKIEVPTIDGRAILKIPHGTKNMQKFRLREKGVFNSRKNTRGDQIVEVSIETPKIQDERTKELLRELAKLHPEDPRNDIWEQVKQPN